MEWWIKEEINKYLNKQVRYMNSVWKVTNVTWSTSNEEFTYYIENYQGNFAKVFENSIELI